MAFLPSLRILFYLLIATALRGGAAPYLDSLDLCVTDVLHRPASPRLRLLVFLTILFAGYQTQRSSF